MQVRNCETSVAEDFSFLRGVASFTQSGARSIDVPFLQCRPVTSCVAVCCRRCRKDNHQTAPSPAWGNKKAFRTLFVPSDVWPLISAADTVRDKQRRPHGPPSRARHTDGHLILKQHLSLIKHAHALHYRPRHHSVLNKLPFYHCKRRGN